MAPVGSKIAWPSNYHAGTIAHGSEPRHGLDAATLAFTIPAGILAMLEIVRHILGWWKGRNTTTEDAKAKLTASDTGEFSEVLASTGSKRMSKYIEEFESARLIQWWQEVISLEDQVVLEKAEWQELGELKREAAKAEDARISALTGDNIASISDDIVYDDVLGRQLERTDA